MSCWAFATHNSDVSAVHRAPQSQPIQFTDGNAVYNAELWDPSTQQFTVMAAAAVPRTYHSIGLLLPDARVFNGGGGLNGPSCGCALTISPREK